MIIHGFRKLGSSFNWHICRTEALRSVCADMKGFVVNLARVWRKAEVGWKTQVGFLFPLKDE